MKLSIIPRIAATTAVAGAVLLGGAGVALADDTTPPAPVPSPLTVAPVEEAPAPSTVAPVEAPGQVRRVPSGAPETGGGATATEIVDEPAGAALPIVLGGGLALVVAGGLVATRRRA